MSLNAKNYSAYNSRNKVRRSSIQQEIVNDKEIKKAAGKETALRKKRRAYGAERRTAPIRNDLIRMFANMTVSDQLMYIAADEIYPPQFYPTKCADSADIATIKSLPENVLYILRSKLVGRHRGPWGAFKKKLLGICGPIKNREPWNI